MSTRQDLIQELLGESPAAEDTLKAFYDQHSVRIDRITTQYRNESFNEIGYSDVDRLIMMMCEAGYVIDCLSRARLNK